MLKSVFTASIKVVNVISTHKWIWSSITCTITLEGKLQGLISLFNSSTSRLFGCTGNPLMIVWSRCFTELWWCAVEALMSRHTCCRYSQINFSHHSGCFDPSCQISLSLVDTGRSGWCHQPCTFASVNYPDNSLQHSDRSLLRLHLISVLLFFLAVWMGFWLRNRVFCS